MELTNLLWNSLRMACNEICFNFVFKFYTFYWAAKKLLKLRPSIDITRENSISCFEQQAQMLLKLNVLDVMKKNGGGAGWWRCHEVEDTQKQYSSQNYIYMHPRY